MKTCRKCSSLFEGRRCGACWKAYQKERHAAHPEKMRERAAKHYRQNKEQVLLRCSVYRVENAQKVKEWSLAWKKANIDKVNGYAKKYRSANPEKVKLATRKWLATKPDQRRIYAENYRAQKQGQLSKDIATKLFRLQRGRCGCCAKPLRSGYHLDHIMPLKRGGLNVDDNMQLLRATCNMQKSAKHPVEFMQERGFLL